MENNWWYPTEKDELAYVNKDGMIIVKVTENTELENLRNQPTSAYAF